VYSTGLTVFLSEVLLKVAGVFAASFLEDKSCVAVCMVLFLLGVKSSEILFQIKFEYLKIKYLDETW
jgi:hypothetical protein